jgi:hypothetical protein
MLSGLLEPLLSRKNQEIVGRNAAVTELNQLKKEIDDEIRRDRMQGKLDLLSPSAQGVQGLKKDNLEGSTLIDSRHLVVKSAAAKEAPKAYTSLRIVAPDTLLENKNAQGTKQRAKNQTEDLDKFLGSSGQVKSAL